MMVLPNKSKFVILKCAGVVCNNYENCLHLPPKSLSEKMAASLVQFMKAEDPNGGGLPQWPCYTSEKCEVMCLDVIFELQYGPTGRQGKQCLPSQCTLCENKNINGASSYQLNK